MNFSNWRNKMLVIGIDDAGRGPLIGPMILAGVLLTPEQEKLLKNEDVKDSKMLTQAQRVKLSKIIKENSKNYKVVKAFPIEIDEFIESKANLNTLEAVKTAEIINSLNDGKEKIKVVVDCPSINTKSWQNKLMTMIKNPDNLQISCEHKADVHHPSVSAASILAKVVREEEVAKIKSEYKRYGDTGSGYPADPVTKAFLKKHGKELADSGIFRKSWQTWKTLFPSHKKQSSLSSFS